MGAGGWSALPTLLERHIVGGFRHVIRALEGLFNQKRKGITKQVASSDCSSGGLPPQAFGGFERTRAKLRIPPNTSSNCIEPVWSGPSRV